MRATPVVLAALAALLTACSPFSPEAGTWQFTEQDIRSNGCDIVLADDLPSLELDVGEDDALTLTGQQTDPDTGETEPVVTACTLGNDEDRQALVCEDQVLTIEEMRTTLTSTTGIGGTFVDEETLEGTTSLNIACDGDACDDIEEALELTLPCRSDTTFIASWSG